MKKCLVVVDFQNDFVTGSLGFPKAKKLEGRIVRKIKEYRKNKGDVIFTYDTHQTNYLETLEGKKLPMAHCLEGTTGHELYGKVAKSVNKKDIKFNKDTFGSKELFDHLVNNKYDSIELVGLVSNICVLVNAVLAKTAQPETPIIVDAKYTASFDRKLHRASLAVMKGLQIEVI
ncbi:MAG: cysteine hydrolase family protein [Oscillospiraceae bacterium]|jgi:nicotinamidase-related amidase|nr:cysteine hydrolase family protein [Oscillospiraceae bacterium]